MVPKNMALDLDNLDITKRIEKLLREGWLFGVQEKSLGPSPNLRTFFIEREKNLKDSIINLWKIS